MNFAFKVVKKEPVDEELCSVSNSGSLIRYEFGNCSQPFDSRPSTAESNYLNNIDESNISCPIKTEPISTDHDPLDDPVNDDLDTNLQIDTEHERFKHEVPYDIDSTTIKTDLQEDGCLGSVKTEAVSPKPEELNAIDGLDIEYNIDVNRVQKIESYCPPNGRNTEVEERILGQSQDLHTAVHFVTINTVSTSVQSNDFPKKCSIEGDSDTNARDKCFSCDVCKKLFIKQHDLLRHIRTHTGEKPFSCNVCAKSFTRKSHSLAHMRTHTGERPFSCVICKKSFTEKGHLLPHMRTHTGEKPFSCNICKKSFAQKGRLITHVRTHTGEKPFSCETCKKSFSVKETLFDHMRTHTGEKPFSCTVCKKSFAQKNNLPAHMRKHTGETPYSCKICNRSFTQKNCLSAHMRTHTG